MTHTTEVVKYEKLSNGQYSYCIRCCGNASTDSWNTLDVTSPETDRAQAMQAAHARVAQEHQASIDAQAEVAIQMGATETHNL